MGRLKRSIQVLWAWGWDWVIDHWPTLIVTIVGGGGMTYLATVSQWLNAYGPVAWGAAALVGLLASAAIYWLVALARLKSAQGTYVPLQYKPGESINPLDTVFDKKRIKIQDLIDPVTQQVSDKVFTGCDLVGPANILLFSGSYTDGEFIHCNCVLVNKKSIKPLTVTRLENVTMIKCRVISATIFIPEHLKDKFGNIDEFFVNR